MQETNYEELNERRVDRQFISKSRIKDKQASKDSLGDWQAESYVKTGRSKDWQAECYVTTGRRKDWKAERQAGTNTGKLRATQRQADRLRAIPKNRQVNRGLLRAT
jgi:hypothetical protein